MAGGRERTIMAGRIGPLRGGEEGRIRRGEEGMIGRSGGRERIKIEAHVFSVFNKLRDGGAFGNRDEGSRTITETDTRMGIQMRHPDLAKKGSS